MFVSSLFFFQLNFAQKNWRTQNKAIIKGIDYLRNVLEQCKEKLEEEGLEGEPRTTTITTTTTRKTWTTATTTTTTRKTWTIATTTTTTTTTWATTTNEFIQLYFPRVADLPIFKKNKAEGTEDDLAKLDARVKDLESDKDALVQKGKVGSIILSSDPNVSNPLVQRREDDADLGAHAIGLVKQKTGVDIVEDDLSKLHFVPGGGLKLKFKNQTQGSKFRKVVQAMKKPSSVQKALNLDVNIELTKKRANLLHEVQKAKREGRLAKYFVDYNGEISILVKPNDKDWTRLTRDSEVAYANSRQGNDDKQPARTFTAEKFRGWIKKINVA